MSETRERIRRTAPERSGPIRNPIIPFPGNGPEAPARAENSGTPGVDANSAASANSPLRGALECGVRTAYSVIDDYMRRGYEAARLNQNPSHERGNMNQHKPGYGQYNPWGPMGPMMDAWSSAFRMWTEAWFSMMPGARGGWGQWPGAGAAYASPTHVNLNVSSKRPVSITLFIHPNADPSRLTLGAFQPALDGIQLIYSDCSFHVRADIADTAAATTYRGMVCAPDGSVAGELKIVILAPPSAG